MARDTGSQVRSARVDLRSRLPFLWKSVLDSEGEDVCDDVSVWDCVCICVQRSGQGGGGPGRSPRATCGIGLWAQTDAGGGCGNLPQRPRRVRAVPARQTPTPPSAPSPQGPGLGNLFNTPRTTRCVPTASCAAGHRKQRSRMNKWHRREKIWRESRAATVPGGRPGWWAWNRRTGCLGVRRGPLPQGQRTHCHFPGW